MSLWDRIKGELIDIIEWLDDRKDTLVHRYPRHDNEIKYGAQLVVREGQAAVFVNEGQVADVFTPGTYTLETRNMPVLSKLKGWKYGFESPFKAEVYFVATRQFTDRKWGTKNAIMLRDAEFGVVRLRAFGTYAVRVSEPATFIREVAGPDAHFTTDEITDQLRNLVVSRFTDILGERRIPALDLAANYTELGGFVAHEIQPDFAAYGLTLTTLLVENISVPPAVEEALDKRTSMGVIGDLSAYTQYQAAQAMEKAAATPGSGAGAGMGMGMGFGMAQQMAQQMGAAPQQHQPPQHQPAPVPPPLPPALQIYAALEGKQAGPFDAEALRTHIQSGKLLADTLVWRQGMPAWLPARDVPAVADLLPATPPPLPGQDG